jgi:ornithine cyclodeaminase
VQAVLVLFSAEDGRPLAVMDGTEITYWRTAADSALGAQYLAPAAPETLLVVGAGELAPWLVRSHRTVRPSLRRVLIWNRTPERAEALAARIGAEHAPELEAAVRAADVITCCTRSRAPLVQGEWLRPGQHLDLVGGFTPETREADDEAACRARVFTDLRESAFHGVGDILGPIAAGVMTEADVLADHYDLCSGRVPGRGAAEELTLFKNAGGGHLDLMTAELVWRRVTGT